MRSGLSVRKQTDEKSERDLAMLGRAGALDRHAQEIAGKNRRALALATDENPRRSNEEIEKLSGNRNP
jgi:hypothetical protein